MPMELLNQDDYKKPIKNINGDAFSSWLDYLFTGKLYSEYGVSVNHYREWYYSGRVEIT